MATQLSVFLENKPGKIEAVTEILARGNVNLRGISIASRGDFGVLKLLPDNPEKAFSLLAGAHYSVSRRAVVIALIDDRPGSLHELLLVLSKNEINIDDCYGIAIEKTKSAAIVLDVESSPDAAGVLQKAGIRLMDESDVHTL